MLKKLIISIVIIILFAFLGYAIYHYKYTPKSSTPQALVIKVNTANAKIMNIPLTRQTIGTLLAPKSITINSQIAGKITKVFINNGQKVKKNDPLFQLDNTKQMADLASAKAIQASKFDTYSRNQKLYKQSGTEAISKTDLNVAKDAYLASKAAVSQATKALANTKINAPVAGVVSALPNNINVGSVINPATILATFVTKNNLQVEYALGEEDLTLVKRGQKVVAWSIDNNKLRYNTQVSYISPTVNAISRAFSLRANIVDPNHHLKPGLLMHVKQTIKPTHQVLSIPGISLIPDLEGYSVYTIIKGKAVKVTVEIGQRYNQYISIKKGLKAGQKVIVSRLNQLKEGTLVSAVKKP